MQKPLNGMLLEPTSQQGRQWLIATVPTVATFQKEKKKNAPPAAGKGVGEVKIRNTYMIPEPKNVPGQYSTLELCLTERKKKFLLCT